MKIEEVATNIRRPRRRVLMIANSRKYLGYISKYAAEHNWQLTIVNNGMCPVGWRGDGAIVSHSRFAEQMDFIRSLVKTPIPRVAMSYVEPEISLPRIVPDYAGLGRSAAEYLCSRGYQNLVFSSVARSPAAGVAYESFADALRSYGVRGEVPWFVLQENIKKSSQFDMSVVCDVVKRSVLTLPAPLGVWCFSDSMAVDFVEAAVNAGISVPNSVGVLGTNDNAMRCENAEIPLSSIHCDFRAIAIKACEALDRAMSGHALSLEPHFVHDLGVVERDSTGVYTDDKMLLRAMEWMRENVGESVGVRQLAVALGASESSICRLFREKLHTTPAVEIRAIKIKRAKSLLRTTDFTLEYIAKTTGFSHSSHFVNAFHACVGETPAVWRQRWR